MKNALQLYCVRPDCERDFKGVLKNLAEIGFDGVEFEKMWEYDAHDLRAWMDEFGLEPAGNHHSIEELSYRIDWVIAYNKVLRNNRIVCRSCEATNAHEIRMLAEILRKASHKLRENGMTLAFHNHPQEMKIDEGKPLLDHLADLLSPEELLFQFDIDWIYRGGGDPMEYIRKYASRLDTCHIHATDYRDVLPWKEMAALLENRIEWLISETNEGVSEGGYPDFGLSYMKSLEK
jgi:sugar phosphate isomerase/epimerase